MIIFRIVEHSENDTEGNGKFEEPNYIAGSHEAQPSSPTFNQALYHPMFPGPQFPSHFLTKTPTAPPIPNLATSNHEP